LGGSVRTRKKSTRGLEIASKETGLGGNAAKTKYMVMSLDQNAGGSHNIKINERVKQFKYLGMTLINQNSIQEEIKRLRYTEL
jgi:hypothetical protein